MKKPKLSAYQTAVEVLSILLMAATLVYALVTFPSLPAKIAGHFNAAGDITSYSGKGSIWLLFGIELIMYVMMTAFMCTPALTEKPNMPWDMDASYKRDIAAETISLLAECKLLCLAMFSYMIWSITQQRPLSLKVIVILCVLMLADVVFRLVNVSKYKKTP